MRESPNSPESQSPKSSEQELGDGAGAPTLHSTSLPPAFIGDEEFNLGPPRGNTAFEASDGEDSLDTIEFSLRLLIERYDNRTASEFFSALKARGAIDEISAPELFRNPEFASIIERLGGKIDFVPARPGELSYVGIVHASPDKLEVRYNASLLERVCNSSFRGEFTLRHPELTIMHEIVGHGHHFLNWRNPVSEGGGLTAGARQAIERILENPDHHALKEFLLQEIRYKNQSGISAKNIAIETSFYEKIFTFLSERRAWQKEIEYFTERATLTNVSSDFVYDEPDQIGTWLDGADGFKLAFKEHIFYGCYQEGYQHYLSGFPDRWKRHEKLRQIEAGISESDPQFTTIIEAAVGRKIAFFYSELDRLPEITELPDEYLT